jgi:predicted RNA-binding Zn ribbon-like protein
MDETAPGELALIERFVNTADLDRGTDALATVEGLTAWLRSAGLAGGPFDAADRERIVAFREALRALLLANHGGAPDPQAIATLDRAAPLVVAFDGDGAASLIAAGDGADGVLARLAAIVARSQAEGTWPRMKACPNDSCGWAFYDRSRNRSRTWCTMSVCGNRVKARSYRARHR